MVNQITTLQTVVQPLSPAKGGGAIIVNFNGSGTVTVANGGGYAVPGTYTDQVSGNQWTVTATTISGQTDSTGIVVLYKSVPVK